MSGEQEVDSGNSLLESEPMAFPPWLMTTIIPRC